MKKTFVTLLIALSASAHGCKYGEKGLLERCELANEDFAFYLQPYAEKEHRHKGVVYEGEQRHWFAMMAEHIEISELQTHFLRPELKIISVHSRNIGNCKSQHRSGNKHIAAAGMTPQSLTCSIKYMACKVRQVGVVVFTLHFG